MSDLTTYRPDPNSCDKVAVHYESPVCECKGENMVVVPDTRLQAIADAWNEVPADTLWKLAVRYSNEKLADLLDALTQEDAE
jgi:hypothetical protein